MPRLTCKGIKGTGFGAGLVGSLSGGWLTQPLTYVHLVISDLASKVSWVTKSLGQ